MLSQSYFYIIQKTLRERGIRIEVDQVGSLLGLEEADGLPVLLDGDPHLREHGLPLLANVLGALQLRFPRFREFCKKKIIMYLVCFPHCLALYFAGYTL